MNQDLSDSSFILHPSSFRQGVTLMPSLHPRLCLRISALVLTLVLGVALISPTWAQPGIDSALPTPRLMTLMPCGGKVGTVLEVTFTGVDLEEPERLLFSHPNIKSE